MLLALLRSLGRRWSRRPAKATQRPRPALRVEPLEDRWVPSVIAGTVYNDLNNDGILQAGEPGIAGNTIELHDGAGNLLATAVTDANGHYQFATNPTVTPHAAAQEVNADFARTKTDWAQDQTLAQFDPSLGHLDSVEIINSATMDSDIQVKSLNPMASTVGGTVKGTVTLTAGNGSPLTVNLATNEQAPVAASDGQMAFSGPGFHDFGEQTSSDSATVTLLSGQQDLSAFIGTGTVSVHESASAVWQGSGSATLLTLVDTEAAAHVRVIYHYTTTNDLAPGSYTLVQPQVPPGFVMGKTTADNVTPLPPSGPPATIPVTLTANGSLNNNFGELLPASISGFVYSDMNENGVKEPGEAGIGGIPIALAGTDDQGRPVSLTTTTAADGSYSFTSLRPGTYSLTKTAEPAGYMKGLDTVGTPGGVTGYNTFTGIQLAQGVNGANNNFGEVPAGALSGFVYNDVHNSGVRTPDDPPIPGTTVTLTGTSLGGLVFNTSVQTNSIGAYGFNNLPPGDYVLTEAQPAGYLQGSNQVGSLGGSMSGDQFLVHLTGGNGTDYNFGEVLPLPPPPPVRPPDLPSPPPPPPVAPPPPQQQQAPPASVTDVAPPSKRDFLGNTWLLWM
jgi:hypothetical protein